MEEIEILEDFIKYYEAEAISRKRGRFLSINVDECDIQALENLIKGYRELEKRIIQLTNLLCINDSDENYILKSKVKEKIEELKKMNLDCDTFGSMRDYAVLILQELMEDK